MRHCPNCNKSNDGFISMKSFHLKDVESNVIAWLLRNPGFMEKATQGYFKDIKRRNKRILAQTSDSQDQDLPF